MSLPSGLFEGEASNPGATAASSPWKKSFNRSELMEVRTNLKAPLQAAGLGSEDVNGMVRSSSITQDAFDAKFGKE